MAKKTTVYLDPDVAACADAVKRLLHVSIQQQINDGLNHMYRDVYVRQLRARSGQKTRRGFGQEVVS
jgi:hypothetical protein